MDEYIQIRIDELMALREQMLERHREELARVDVRIDELKSMGSETSLPRVQKTLNSVLDEEKELPVNAVASSVAKAAELPADSENMELDDIEGELDFGKEPLADVEDAESDDIDEDIENLLGEIET